MSDGGNSSAPETVATAQPRAQRSGGRRRSVRLALFLVFDLVILLIICVLVAGVVLAGKDIAAPDWVSDKVEQTLTDGLGGGSAEIGEVSLRWEIGKLPTTTIRNLQITAPNGAELLSVPTIGVSLDAAALWRREVRPRELSIDGASLRLRRDAQGNFDLGFGDGQATARIGSMDEAVASFRRVFDLPALQPIGTISVTGLSVDYSDLRAQRDWQIEDGSLGLTQGDDTLAISINARLADRDTGDDPVPATLSLGLSLDKHSPETELSVLVEDVVATDVAVQAPALSWLEPLKARVSGAITTGITAAGEIGDLHGTLSIGAGVFQPETAVQPIPFDAARAYFSFRPEISRIDFTELSFSGPDGSLSASGHTYLEGLESGWPKAMVSQLAISSLRLDRDDLLPEPAVFETGAADIRFSLDPFEARIGQLTLSTVRQGKVSRFDATGRVTADSDGWKVALDMALDRVSHDDLMSHWPVFLVPLTRKWIDRRLLGGEIRNVAAGLRLTQGRPPDLAVTFEFDDVKFRPLDTLPPIEGGRGLASVGRDLFSLSLDAGRVLPPEGGVVDLAGSDFRIADMKAEPKLAEIFWHSNSSITAALSLLDQRPFGFLTQAGLPVTLSDGRALLDGRIAFPLGNRVAGKDVDFDIAGRLDEIGSTQLVPGRNLAARTLNLRATPDRLTIAGAASLETVPLEAEFVLPFGEDVEPASVAGTIRIGRDAVERFELGLPDGMITGAGPGQFTVKLPKGAAPSFVLSSRLAGVGLALGDLGWSMSADAQGRLLVSGRFGSPPVIDQLTLEAPGLTALGAISITPAGGLERALFSRVTIGSWFDAPVTLRGRGANATPAVEVGGGTVDIRRMTSGGSGSGGSGTPIAVALDRLIVSDGLELTGFRGEFDTAGGFSGDFTGDVNGKARVRGTLSPTGRGSAVRLRSDNAGAVFAAAGIFRQANGGAMDLSLRPRQQQGTYDGDLKVTGVRVKSASTLTALINAVSVVGLLDELQGGGILFDDVEAAFRLTPTHVQVTRSSGVGPSLGITMEGIYDLIGDRLDMQGVFSPIYMVNSIGSIFTRKGEGLFGVTYRMRGAAQDPSVEMNPLSALTPGMFREIFRAAPPRAPGGG